MSPSSRVPASGGMVALRLLEACPLLTTSQCAKAAMFAHPTSIRRGAKIIGFLQLRRADPGSDSAARERRACEEVGERYRGQIKLVFDRLALEHLARR